VNTHVSEDKRRQIVELIQEWQTKTVISAKQLVEWCSLPYSKFLRWRKRLQNPMQKSAKPVPKSHWLLPEEVQAIVDYSGRNPGHGYRRLTWILHAEKSTVPSRHGIDPR
jgi:hypothetical protein